MSSHDSPDRSRVLVVDDDLTLRIFTTIVLAREGYSPTAVGNVPRALERVAEGKVDVVVTDLLMPGLNGLDLLRALRSARLTPPVVAMTGSDEGDLVGRALALGALLVVRKPFTRETLVAAVQYALDEGGAAA